MLERDLRLVEITGARYHAAQVSAAASLEVIRTAKAKGLPVSCGVSINHLVLNENDIGAYRTFFKLSPPLRTEDDRRALVAGVADGTIDVIVSSHDPQDADTKRLPFAEAEFGAIGLETLLPAALSLHHRGEAPLARLIDALSTQPSKLLGLETGRLAPGAPADFVIADPDIPWTVVNDKLRSRSKNTPFEHQAMQGRAVETVVAGRTVYTYA
jgi:dihydroorotase